MTAASINLQMVVVGLSAALAGRTVDGCLLPPETAEITQGDQFGCVFCVVLTRSVVALAGKTQQPKVTI